MKPTLLFSAIIFRNVFRTILWQNCPWSIHWPKSISIVYKVWLVLDPRDINNLRQVGFLRLRWIWQDRIKIQRTGKWVHYLLQIPNAMKSCLTIKTNKIYQTFYPIPSLRQNPDSKLTSGVQRPLATLQNGRDYEIFKGKLLDPLWEYTTIIRISGFPFEGL